MIFSVESCSQGVCLDLRSVTCKMRVKTCNLAFVKGASVGRQLVNLGEPCVEQVENWLILALGLGFGH